MTEGRRAWIDRFSRFLVVAAMGTFAIGWAVSGMTKGYVLEQPRSPQGIYQYAMPTKKGPYYATVEQDTALTIFHTVMITSWILGAVGVVIQMILAENAPPPAKEPD